MDLLLTFFGVGLTVTLVFGPVLLALYAVARTRRLERRLEVLQRRLDRAEAPMPAPTPERRSPELAPTVRAEELERLPRSEPSIASVDSDAKETQRDQPDADGELAAKSAEDEVVARPAADPAPREGASDPEPLAPVPAASIDWERWFGVRGAALLGGIAAALAGILLFQHAIQEGWITEPLRLAMGAVAGVALVAGGERLRPRPYRYVPDALVGAGVVCLYATSWAASRRYGLWPDGLSFAAMAAITVATALLAGRARSQTIAFLGLAGGFATPLLLASDVDRPVGLFGYLLLLDLGLLFLARRNAWPSLALVGLLATAAFQWLWLGNGFDPLTQDWHFAFAMMMVGSFGLLFALATTVREDRDSEDDRQAQRWTQSIGLLLPFGFGIYFARHADVGDAFLPYAALCSLLLAASGWLARTPGLGHLPIASAVGVLGLSFTWLADDPALGPQSWPFAGGLVAFAAIAWGFEERRRAAGGALERSSIASAPVLLFGGLVMLLVSTRAERPLDLGPLVAGATAFVLLGAHLARTRTRDFAWLPLVTGLTLSLIVTSQLFERTHDEPGGSSSFVVACVLVGFAMLLHGLVPRRGDDAPQEPSRPRKLALTGAAVYPILPLTFLAAFEAARETPIAFRFALLVALVAAHLVACARVGSRVLYGIGAFAACAAILQTKYANGSTPTLAVGLVATWLVATAWAVLPRVSAPMRSRPNTSWVLLPASLFFFGVAREFVKGLELPYLELVAGLPVALGTAALAFPRAARSRPPVAAAARLAGASVAVLVGALAIAREVDVTPWTVAGGLAAGGIALAWRHLVEPDPERGLATSAGLAKHLAVGLAVLSAAGAIVELLSPSRGWLRPEGGLPLLHSIAWAHLVPAAGALAAAALFQSRERERFTPLEERFWGDKAGSAALCGASGAVLIFLWLNLAVLELATEGGAQLEFPGGDQQGAHLALSLTWVGYALALLTFGMVRHSRGPRWASLVVLLASIAKVFLHDLGDLEGLTRVASLAGLAVCLIAVSLLYQRFVFRARPALAAPDAP